MAAALRRASSRLASTTRSFTTNAQSTAQEDRIGAAAATAYWCTVVGAPLGAAFYVSRAARKDKKLANFRQLSFRDCLPASSLDDYAGAYMRLRR
ncbi:hypothetical protein CERZMDRAFT_102972 [Cercospora zeae-maydis SCOH1-5]|uniref:Uncharacterized protein n=1 Tax=Cercospora zeae-maydis SCOH1-5 TaxID=717836 RepID=A0A6A6F2P2_9PEZI|nr:hypothetical protein CERZMDRAFT_102972 [Cercospora zeae-maydis SCOH1-5]